MPVSFKKIYSVALLIIFCLVASVAYADEIAKELRGRILLQVEQKGEAWYVNPVDNKRIFLGHPQDAFNIMRELGLGVSNETFDHFKDNVVPSRLAGRILLNVENLGRAYYVNPLNMEMLYLGRPQDAFNVMRSLGLGITDLDLNKILISDDFFETKKFLEENKASTASLMKMSDHCISDMELDLAERINKYRVSKNLSEISISKSLSYVAKVHLKDLVDNKPASGSCNAHSWSSYGPWEECCYPEESECIQNKAKELTKYTGDAVENIHWWDDGYHTPSPAGALNGWINSEGHHIVIINEGWAKDFEWKALGVAIYKNYAAMWVGESVDPAGRPDECGACNGFLDKEWEYSCYTDKAIFENDKNYCSYVDNSLEREHCTVRTGIYSCSSLYDSNNFECYRELIKEDIILCGYLYSDESEIENCRKFSNWN